MINHHDDDNGDDNNDDGDDNDDNDGDDNGDEHAEFVALVQVTGLPSPLVFHRSEKGKRGAGRRTLGGNFGPRAVTLDSYIVSEKLKMSPE